MVSSKAIYDQSSPCMALRVQYSCCSSHALPFIRNYLHMVYTQARTIDVPAPDVLLMVPMEVRQDDTEDLIWSSWPNEYERN